MIMIMDIYLKVVIVSVDFDGEIVMINGIVKGVGMIVLDMVMMLLFVFIDVVISLDVL